jgi:hypothetical protein
MRIVTLAITGVLATCVAALPADAAKKRASEAVGTAQQRQCKTVYVDGPLSEACSGSVAMGPFEVTPCRRAWRVKCSK